jgi:drug/metabolite transporter (DMT)-like permease
MIKPASPARLAVAHASVWLIWGSTYLGVRVLVQTVPPFFGMGSRFLLAGIVVALFLRARGVTLPAPAEWRAAMVGGVMLVAAGNGAVAYTEQTVPSSLVALTVALMPAWMLLFDWFLNGAVPGRVTIIGLALGFVGVAILIGPSAVLGAGEIPLFGAATVTVGSMSWALGSILTRRAARPKSVMMGTAAQMIWGGGTLLVVALFAGEYATLTMAMLTPTVTLVWLYLLLVGSIVAYSAYVYLLHHTEPAKASSYAFVNPVIAVLVGWGLGGEALSPRVGIAAVLIVCAVALIVRYRD